MMDRIRQGLGLGPVAQHRLVAVGQWLARRAIAVDDPVDGETMLVEFVNNATNAGAVVMAETNLQNIPALIHRFVVDKNLPNQLVITDPALAFLKNIIEGEQDITVLDDIVTKPATLHQVVSLTLGLAAIAESGTVMVASNPANPSRMYFLPTAHVLLVSCQQLVARYEDALAFLTPTAMPRGVHFITGPSRTADIDQTITVGMHGPKELLIILTP